MWRKHWKQGQLQVASSMISRVVCSAVQGHDQYVSTILLQSLSRVLPRASLEMLKTSKNHPQTNRAVKRFNDKIVIRTRRYMAEHHSD